MMGDYTAGYMCYQNDVTKKILGQRDCPHCPLRGKMMKVLIRLYLGKAFLMNKRGMMMKRLPFLLMMTSVLFAAPVPADPVGEAEAAIEALEISEAHLYDILAARDLYRSLTEEDRKKVYQCKSYPGLL